MRRFFTKYRYYLSSIYKLLTGVRERRLILRLYLGMAGPGPHHVHLRRSGASFWVRSAMDMWSVKETFLDRMYERFGTRVEDGWTVVDIGAGIGEFTIFAALGHSRNRVFGFEPFSESFTLLQRNVAANRVTGIEVINAAVSAESGGVELDISGGEPLSLRSYAASDSQRSHVRSFSLEDALAHCRVDQCDLLKLDCEGAEYDILMSARPDVLARVRRIVMEYHDGVSGHSHGQLAAFLQTNGYVVRIQPNFVHADLGYMYCYRG